ncbi:hypothetical protein BGZ79_003850 [Entomortierella chlamydospora]|nr:hypothetical protein BGZ79_003850 [Entomortierella chlamydospora]
MSSYSYALMKHYDVLGPEKMRQARIKAPKLVKDHTLDTKQRLKTQQGSEAELDREKASGSTSSVDSFLIPQDKADFGRMTEAAPLSCIELAIRIQDELCR